MNVSGSMGSIPHHRSFTVGKKGELLFEGKSPKEVREISPRGSMKREGIETLARVLNDLYEKEPSRVLDAEITTGGKSRRIQVVIEKENITKEVLNNAKLSFTLRKGTGLSAKEIVQTNDGNFEIIFEAKAHPDREIRESFTADEIRELAKVWEKHLKK